MINSTKITMYGVAAIATLSVMVFVVLPQLPQVKSVSDTVSTEATAVSAWDGGSGGEGGCCGDGGGGGGDNGGGGGDYIPPVAAKCLYLNASQTTLPHGGGNVTLSWSTQNATSVSISGIGTVAASGSRSVAINSNTTFTLTAKGAGGDASCTVTIKVEAPKPPAKCIALNVNKTTLPAGGSVTVSWSTENATGVTLWRSGAAAADGSSVPGHGAVLSLNGSHTMTINQTTTFRLDVWNAETSATCTKTVTVEAPKPAAKCVSFTASQTTLPHGGGNVTLNWSTQNATSVSISGIGTVAASGSRSVNVTGNTTFTLTATGAGGNDSCTVTIKVNPPVEKPAAKCISFTANKTTVKPGETVTLTWSTQNATSVSISGIGTVAASGSRSVAINSNTTFTLTAKGAGGDASCTVTIKVEAPKPAAKCVSFTASQTTLPHGGGNVTLSWSTQNATSVSISGIGTVAASGSRSVNVTSNRTFTLTATGTGGNDSCTVTINVNPPVDKPAAKCISFTANKSVVQAGGENVTLSWVTENASSVSINNGGGNFSGNSGSTTVFVNSDTTFTLTANGAGGNASCAVTVKVETSKPAAKCVSFTANRTTVPYEGGNVTLNWNTENASSVHINNGVGNVQNSGSRSVFVDNDTTFTLTVNGTHGGDTCTVTVRTDDREEDDQPRPRCELEISKTRVNRGERVTLSWETRNADSLRIRDDRGNTIFDTNDYRSSERRRYLTGEVDLIINQNTAFTLTARGEGGSRTCTVEVRVDDLAVYEKRDQGMVIALTQVPYTGFEAGPFLTFLFYAVLTLWALFIAYILVIKRGTVLGFSLYGKNAGMSQADAENRKKVEALVAKYADRNWN